MSEMVSFGAGVNSVAMTIMLVEGGWRGPIVFADTGAEHPETYCYIEYFEREYLKPRGLGVTRLLPGSEYHARGKKGTLTLEGYCLHAGLIPLLAMRWCSIAYKRQPCLVWMADHDMDMQLLGISSDEPRRVRYDDSGKRYPLVEATINRSECKRIIQRAGLDAPRKSGCFFCPGQTLGQWRSLFYNQPDLFERALALEDNATSRRRSGGVASFDPGGRPLREHIVSRYEGPMKERQMQMDLSQWLPCACRL